MSLANLPTLFVADPLVIDGITRKLINQKANGCKQNFTSEEAVFVCMTCGDSGQNCFCHDCFFNGNHKDHFWRLDETDLGQCDCGHQGSFAQDCFCSKHQASQVLNDILYQLQNLEVEELIFMLRYCKTGFVEGFFNYPDLVKLIMNFQIFQDLAAFIFLNNQIEIDIQEAAKRFKFMTPDRALLDMESNKPSFFIDFINGSFQKDREFIQMHVLPSKYFQQVGLREINRFHISQFFTQKSISNQIKFYLLSDAETYSLYKDSDIVLNLYAKSGELLNSCGFTHDQSSIVIQNFNAFDNVMQFPVQATILQSTKLLCKIIEIQLQKSDNLRQNVNQNVEYFNKITQFYENSLYFESNFVVQHHQLFNSLGVDFGVESSILKQATVNIDVKKSITNDSFKSMHLNNISEISKVYWKYYSKDKLDEQFFEPFPCFFMQDYLVTYCQCYHVDYQSILVQLSTINCTTPKEFLQALLNPFIFSLIWYMKIIYGDINKQNIENHYDGVNFVTQSKFGEVLYLRFRRCKITTILFNLLDIEARSSYFQFIKEKFLKTNIQCIIQAFYYLIFVPDFDQQSQTLPFLISNLVTQQCLVSTTILLRNFGSDQVEIQKCYQKLMVSQVSNNFLETEYQLKDTSFVEPYFFITKMDNYFSKQFELNNQFGIHKHILEPFLCQDKQCYISNVLIDESLSYIQLFAKQKISIGQAISVLRFLKMVNKLDLIQTLEIVNNPVLTQFFVKNQQCLQQLPPKINAAKAKMIQFQQQKLGKRNETEDPRLLSISEKQLTQQTHELCVLCHQAILDVAFFPLKTGKFTNFQTNGFDCCQHLFHFQCLQDLSNCPYCQFEICDKFPIVTDGCDIPGHLVSQKWFRVGSQISVLFKQQIDTIFSLINVKDIIQLPAFQMFLKRQLFILHKMAMLAPHILEDDSFFSLLEDERYQYLYRFIDGGDLTEIESTDPTEIIAPSRFFGTSYDLLRHLHENECACGICAQNLKFTLKTQSQNLFQCLNCGKFAHKTCFDGAETCTCKSAIFFDLLNNAILLRKQKLQKAPYLDLYDQFVPSIFDFMQILQPQLVPFLNFQIVTHLTFESQHDNVLKFERVMQLLRVQIGDQQVDQMLTIMGHDELYNLALDMLEVDPDDLENEEGQIEDETDYEDDDSHYDDGDFDEMDGDDSIGNDDQNFSF